MLTLNQRLDIVVLVQRKICAGDGARRRRREGLHSCGNSGLSSRWTSALSDKIAFDFFFFLFMSVYGIFLCSSNISSMEAYIQYTHTHANTKLWNYTAVLKRTPHHLFQARFLYLLIRLCYSLTLFLVKTHLLGMSLFSKGRGSWEWGHQGKHQKWF